VSRGGTVFEQNTAAINAGRTTPPAPEAGSLPVAIITPGAPAPEPSPDPAEPEFDIAAATKPTVVCRVPPLGADE
jgi:hypothetical protein